jgi:ABC-type glycerol-3-phosphate transport system substrate-binding protein
MRRTKAFLLVVILLSAALPACHPPTETATPPKGPLNTTLSLTAGLATATHRAGSGGKGGLAAPVPQVGAAYVLTFPNGEAILAPEPGERFTLAVGAQGNIVKQADRGDMESASGSARRFTVPEGQRWVALPGRITVLVSPIDKSPALDADTFVPPQGTRDAEPIPELPTEEIEFIDIVEEAEEAPAEPEEAPTAEVGGELEIWHPWVGQAQEHPIRLAIEAFEAQHPDVTLRVLDSPPEEMRTLYAARLAAGETPDLILLDNTAIPPWASQDWLQPLDDLEDGGSLDHVLPSALETVRYEGHLWAIPFQGTTVALYYDRQALPAPPADVEEWRAMLDEGYTLALPNQVYYLYGFLRAYSDQVDVSEPLPVDRKAVINYLTFAQDLIEHENTFYGSVEEVQEAFSTGKAQMIVDGVWMLPPYREALGDALGVSLLPYAVGANTWPRPVLNTSASLVPPSHSAEERELALRFALLLTTEPIQQQIVERGQAVPVNPAVRVEDLPLNAFLKQATLADPGPLHLEQALIWSVLQRMQEQVIEDQERVEVAAESAESELRSVDK